MMQQGERTVSAKCRICGRNLTVSEFRACAGTGHYCAVHLRQPSTPRPQRQPSTSPRRPRSRAETDGATSYRCKAQFASSGVIRSGVLTRDHPSCPDDGYVFVHEGIGYGPGEIARLFVRSRAGRDIAQRMGFDCSE